MFQRILVPLDGSARAERAIPVAARVARAVDGTIVFIRVIVPIHDLGVYGVGPVVTINPGVLEADIAEARSYLSSIIDTFHEELRGIKTEVEIESGEITSAILSKAGLKHCDLILLCSHGDVGLKRWVLRSVAQQTIRHSPVPVLILNEHDAVHALEETGHPLNVLMPLDGSALSEAALEPAVELMKAFSTKEGRLHLVSVINTPYLNGNGRDHRIDVAAYEQAHGAVQAYLDRVAKELQDGLLAQTRIAITTFVMTSTDVPKTILRQIDEIGCDMIAMATHGRGGLMRLLMGSVAEQVLGHTMRPLLIVRPAQKEGKQKVRDEESVASS